MGTRLIGAILAGTLVLALAACEGGGAGSSDESDWSVRDMVGCLKQAGAQARRLAAEDLEMAAAQASDGEDIFILHLPEPGLAGLAGEEIRKQMNAGGFHRIMTVRTLNQGLTVILVFGVEGVDGGVPSAAGEELARRCASRPRLGPTGKAIT